MRTGLSVATLCLVCTGLFCLNKTTAVKAQMPEMRALSCTDCTDIAPGGTYTCLEQKFFGKCSAQWMREGGYCMATCGFCSKCATDGRMDDASTSSRSSVSPSPPRSSQNKDELDCSCTDVQPPGPYTCNEQKFLGKCKAIWMITTPHLREGFCQITCGRCNCIKPTEIELLKPALPIAENCSCTDVIPPGKNISCREQRSYGKCEADWMLDTTIQPEGYCQTTCGRCFCSTNDAPIDPPTSVAPPPPFVPPLRAPSPEPVKSPARLPPDPLGRSSFPVLSVSPPQLQMPDELPEPLPFTRSSVISGVPIIVVPVDGIPTRLPLDPRAEEDGSLLNVLEPIAESTFPGEEPDIEGRDGSYLEGGIVDGSVLPGNLQPLDELGEDWTARSLVEPSVEPSEDEDPIIGLVIDTGSDQPSVEPNNELDFDLDSKDAQPGTDKLDPPATDALEDFVIDIDAQPSIEPLHDSLTDYLLLGMEDITPVYEPDAELSIEDVVTDRETIEDLLFEPSLEPSSDQDVIGELLEGFQPMEEPTSEALTHEDVDTIEDGLEFPMELSIEPIEDQLEESGREPSDEKDGKGDDEIIAVELGFSFVPLPEVLEDQDHEHSPPESEGDLDPIEELLEPNSEDISDIEQDLDMSGEFLFGPSMEPIVEPLAEPLSADIDEGSRAQSNREEIYDLAPADELNDSLEDITDKSMTEPLSETSTVGYEDTLIEFEGPAAEIFASASTFEDLDEGLEAGPAGAMAAFEEVSSGLTEEPAVTLVEPLDEEPVSVPAGQIDESNPPPETETSLEQKLPSSDNCTATGALLKSRKNISIFTRMITAAGLMDDEGNLQFKGTLLAPDDRAVEKYLAANELDLDELLKQDALLKALISFFVIDEVLYLEDLYNGMQVKPRVMGAEPLIVLRTDLTLRGRLESIIVIVGARETARIIGSGLVTCDVAVHILDRFIPPSVTAPILPSTETVLLEEPASETATALDIPPKPEEDLIPTDIDNSPTNINTPPPQVGPEPGLTASLLEGILDYEDDPTNNQMVIAGKMIGGEAENPEPQNSNRGE